MIRDDHIGSDSEGGGSRFVNSWVTLALLKGARTLTTARQEAKSAPTVVPTLKTPKHLGGLITCHFCDDSIPSNGLTGGSSRKLASHDTGSRVTLNPELYGSDAPAMEDATCLSFDANA